MAIPKTVPISFGENPNPPVHEDQHTHRIDIHDAHPYLHSWLSFSV